MRRCLSVAAVLAGCLAFVTAPSAADAPAEKGFLLNVGKGQLPPDTGQDDKTTPKIVEDFQGLGGGKALEVRFAPGDSFGARAGSSKDWKRFTALRFDAYNPSEKPVSLELTVVHARSTSFQTRVVVPIRLKPGRFTSATSGWRGRPPPRRRRPFPAGHRPWSAIASREKSAIWMLI